MVVDLDRVTATCEGTPVADHPRSWAKHQTFTDPVHTGAAQTLRRGRNLAPRPLPIDPVHEVEQRDLRVYDQLTYLPSLHGRAV